MTFSLQEYPNSFNNQSIKNCANILKIVYFHFILIYPKSYAFTLLETREPSYHNQILKKSILQRGNLKT